MSGMIEQFALGLMKSWLCECFSDEYDQEQIMELSFEHTKRAINRYYEGGFSQFMEDSQLYKEVTL